MAKSNTSRTLEYMRDIGYKCGMVERRLSFGGAPDGAADSAASYRARFGRTVDLFNVIDIIAIRRGITIGVQSTGSGHAAHNHKLLVEHRQDTIDWLAAGNVLLLISWRKVKRKNKDGSWSKSRFWAPRIVQYGLTTHDDIVFEEKDNIDVDHHHLCFCAECLPPETEDNR